MTRAEAIEIIRKNMPSDKSLPVYEAIQTLVPELSENDDEKIRKEMIRYFTEMKKGGSVALPYDDCIAYLKQKEQKPEHFELKAGKWYICHRAFCARADHLTVKEGERFQCKKDGIVKGFVIKEPEKYFKECSTPEPMQKEQKPVEWDKEDKEMFEAVDESLYCYESGKAPEMVAQIEAERCWLHSLPERFNLQPKQEWSEEDKGLLLSTKCVIDEVWHSENTFGYSKEELEEIWNWLNVAWTKLEYPKENNEWSKEDENMIDCIIRSINQESIIEGFRYYAIPYTLNEIASLQVKMFHWLKSLRPQPHKWYIKKGHWYMCIVDKPEYGWTKGKVYQSPEDNRIETNYKGSLTNWPDKEPWFRPATRSEIPDNQPHWKPSEQEMSALNYFIKLWGNSDDQLEYTQIFKTVKSLRDKLKELM